MKKLVYIKTRKLDDFKLVCIHKDYEHTVRELLSASKYRFNIYSFDFNSVYIEKNDYNISDRTFWYEVLTILKNNEFAFTEQVESRYEYYVKEHLKLEEQKRVLEENEKAKQEEKERLEKERLDKIKKEENEYAFLCLKYDCLTNIEFCRKKCEYNTKYNMNCRPKKIRIRRT